MATATITWACPWCSVADARAVTTPGTLELMRRDTSPEARNPVALQNFRARFPGQIADTVALPEPLDAEYFELEGRPIEVIETGHTDGVNTTSLHVPDLDLIVSGDVAYNRCHMYVGATNADNRAEWIAALDKLAALNPKAVIAGHKDPTRANPPSVLAESQGYLKYYGQLREQGYLEYYGQLREQGLADQELFDAMVSRYPDWVSRQQFLILGLG